MIFSRKKDFFETIKVDTVLDADHGYNLHLLPTLNGRVISTVLNYDLVSGM